MRRGFTLVELISSIAILALITVTLVVTIPNFINWARETSDKQTLTVLNDALNRYKTQGGDVNALTTGTPISRVISKLQTAVTWSGKSHEFLQTGKTYLGRSIAALGEHHQYRFTRYDHYEQEAGGMSPEESSYPYGEGVGYVSNGGSGEYYWFGFGTTTGWWAAKDASNNVTTHEGSGQGVNVTLPASAYYTVWSCVDDGDPTPAGSVTWFEVSDDFNYTNLTSVNVSGLTGLESLCVAAQQISSIDLSGLVSLTELRLQDNQITSLDLSDQLNLTLLRCDQNPITSLDVRHIANLQLLYCGDSLLSSLDVSGLDSLTTLYCVNSQLGLINTAGCTSLPAPSTNWSTLFNIDPTASVTGQWTYP